MTATPRSVFITGALGLIGRRLAERYREAGAEVRGMDVRADPAAGVVAGDLTVPGAWQDAAAGRELCHPHRGGHRHGAHRPGHRSGA